MTYDVRAGFRGYVQFNKYTHSSRDTVLDKGNQRYTTAVPTRTESVKRIYGASLDVGCTRADTTLELYGTLADDVDKCC